MKIPAILDDKIKKNNQDYICNDEFKTNLNLIKKLTIKIKYQNSKSQNLKYHQILDWRKNLKISSQ